MLKLRKLTGIILSMIMLFSTVAPFTVNSATVDLSSTAYIEEDFLLTTDADGSVVLLGYTGADTELTIPENVDIIRKEAFKQCRMLEKIVIPATVKKLEEGVFFYSEDLMEVEINAEITEIPSETFYRCLKLKTVTLPNTVTKIGDNAFTNCVALESVILPAQLKEIGVEAFALSGLKSIDFNDSIEAIGENAFASCSALEQVTLPESLMTIESGAFSECKALETLTVSKNVKVIGGDAFKNCTGLKTVNFNAVDYTCDQEGVFEGCTAIENIILGDDVKTIQRCTFTGILTDFEINLENVEIIGDYAFANCTGLTQAVVFNADTEFGGTAYEGCSADLTFYCYKNSTAEKYATDNKFKVVLADDNFGDADKNGKVSIKDATKIQLYCAQFVELDQVSRLYSDVNRDSKLNINDVTQIQKYLAEVMDKF